MMARIPRRSDGSRADSARIAIPFPTAREGLYMPTDTTPTDAEAACFEAGIKFGALYHQFAGTPVSPDSAASLETAMEESIENQPFCEDVTVEILTEKLAEEVQQGYTELTGRFMEVEIVVDHEGVDVVTRME